MSKRRDMPKVPDQLIEDGRKLMDKLHQRFLDSSYGRVYQSAVKSRIAARGPKKRKSPKAEKVLKILRKDPKRRTNLIVKEVGCSSVYVNQLRKELLEKKRN
jgi:hypothetical protein